MCMVKTQHCIRWGPDPHDEAGFDAAYAKLLWPLVSLSYFRHFDPKYHC